MPEEQFSILEGAIFDHEMFSSWIQAGFTREEAMQLLLRLKADAIRSRICIHCGRPISE